MSRFVKLSNFMLYDVYYHHVAEEGRRSGHVEDPHTPVSV